MKEQRNRSQALVGQPTIFQVVGFDRLNFVGDVTNAIPQNEQCHITNILFEADGVRARGYLTVHVTNPHHLVIINRQLRSVRGLVSINQTN